VFHKDDISEMAALDPPHAEKSRRLPGRVRLFLAAALACGMGIVQADPVAFRPPNVSCRAGGKGGPVVFLDNAPYTPLFYMCNNRQGSDEASLKGLREAAGAGIPFHVFNMPLARHGTAEQAAEIVERYRQAHPEGYFLIRVALDPDVSGVDESWRETTSGMLRDSIRLMAEGPHGARFIGVIIEWSASSPEEPAPDTGGAVFSQADVNAFRSWLRHRYAKDDALRKAWNNPAASFEDAAIPTPEECDKTGWGPFRDPFAHRQASDFEAFQCDLAADTLAYFAGIVKETGARRLLAGAVWNGNGPASLERLAACQKIDMLLVSYSVFPGESMRPSLDSPALHGMLCVLDEPGPDLFGIFGHAFSHRCGFSYSVEGGGEAALRPTMPLLRRLQAELRGMATFEPQVAFLFDEQARHWVIPAAWREIRQSLSRWQSELDRIGAPVGWYLQRDLPNLPDSVRVIVLANAFAIDKAGRRAIEKRLDRGATVVWALAPDIVGPDGVACARIAGITGMDVEPKPGTASGAMTGTITGEEFTIAGLHSIPRFVVASADVDIVARHKDTGEIAAAARPLRKGVSVYTAAPFLPMGIMRTICARAGVHLYRDTPGATGVAGHYLFVQAETEGTHTFQWPYPCRTVERIVPPGRRPITPDADRRWSDTLPARTTALYASYAD